MTTCWNRM